MTYKVSDNAASTLASGISNSPAVTSLILTDAANFPVINHGGSGSDYTYVTLYDAANNIENVKVTRRDSGSNTLTIVRGTAAGITGVSDASCLAWSGTTTGVACRLIAQTVNEMVAQSAASHVATGTGAHAATAISFAPIGTIASTDVQSAIAELYSETQTALSGKSSTSHNHDASYASAAQGTKADSALQPSAIGVTVQGYDVNTTKTNAKQNFTAQQRAMAGTLTDGATINWDGDVNGQIVALTLAGNRTMAAPTNIQQYAMYMMRITQDATGSRLISTWNGAFKFGGAGAPVLTTTAEKTDWLSFIGGAGNTLEYLGARKNAV